MHPVGVMHINQASPYAPENLQGHCTIQNLVMRALLDRSDPSGSIMQGETLSRD